VFNVPTSTPAPQRLSKRAVEYLSFDEEGQSILVANEADAAVFSLDADGNLRSGTRYVGLDEAVDPLRFKVQDTIPETPVEINIDADGNVSVPDVQGFCVQGDDLVVLTDDTSASDACQAVEIALDPADEDVSTTTSDTVATTSSTSSVLTSTTTGKSYPSALLYLHPLHLRSRLRSRSTCLFFGAEAMWKSDQGDHTTTVLPRLLCRWFAVMKISVRLSRTVVTGKDVYKSHKE